MKFFTEATFKIDKCGGEWKTYGGCCDVNSLTNFSQIDRLNIKYLYRSGVHQSSKIMKYIYYYKVVLGLSFKILRNRVLEDKELTGAEKSTILTQLAKARDTYFEDIKESSDWMNQNTARVIGNQMNCLNTIGDLRSNSACYACSGRAQVYFTNGMLNVNEEECRATIAKCSGAWMDMFTLIEQVNKFNKQVRSLRLVLGINFSKMMNKEASSMLLDWSHQFHLASNLASCQDGLCKFPVAKSICESLLSYDKPLYLRQVLNMVKNDISNTDVQLGSKEQKSMINRATKYYEKMSTKVLMSKLARMNLFIPRRLVTSQNKKPKNSKPSATMGVQKPSKPSAPKKSQPASSPKPRTGRKLVLTKPPSGAVAKALAPVVPALTPIIAVAANALQNTMVNPLLCGRSAAICVAEKVVQTVSDCTLGVIQCTNPTMCFP